MFNYTITCKTTTRIYFGITRDLGARFRDHRNMLKSGFHSNRELQADYDLYGMGDFEFLNRGERSAEEARKWEKEHIRRFHQTCYNQTGRPGTKKDLPVTLVTVDHILRLLREGMTGRAIAKTLRRGPGTVSAVRHSGYGYNSRIFHQNKKRLIACGMVQQ